MTGFINNTKNITEVNNSVYKNMVIIPFIPTIQDAEHHLETILYSNDIKEIKDIFDKCKYINVYKYKLLFHLSERTDIFDELCTHNILKITDYQFIYINAILKFLGNNDANINTFIQKIKHVYNIIKDTHNIKTILDVLIKCYRNETQRNRLLYMYNMISKDELANLLSVLNEMKIMDNVKLIELCNHYNLHNTNNCKLLKTIFKSCSYMDAITLYDKYIYSSNNENDIVVHSIYNDDESIFFKLINDNFICTYIDVLIYCLQNNKVDILERIKKCMRFDTLQKLTDYILTDKNINKNNIKYIFENNLIDPQTDEYLILRKAIIGENNILTKYILTHYEIDKMDNKTKNKIKKIAAILDDEDLRDFIMSTLK